MENKTGDGIMNVGFSVWVSICVFLGLWLWSTFTKGRRNFQNNLHVIEEGLRKMQNDLEMRQRENSMGCVDDVEDISEFLRKFYEEGKNANEKQMQTVPENVKEGNDIENEDKEAGTENSEESETKKTI